MRNQPSIRQSIEISQEEVDFWKAEIRAGIKRQKDEFINRIGYERLIQYFEALQVAEGAKINQMAIVDEVSPAILSVIGATYNQNPSTVTVATHPAADGFVQPQMMYLLQHPEFKPFKLTDLMDSAVKYGTDKIGMKEEMQIADFDLLVAGFCAIEINYLSEDKDKAQSTQDQSSVDQGQNGYDNPILQKITDGIKSGISSVIDTVKNSLTKDEAEEKIASEVQNERVDFTDVTYCKRWNPLDIIFDSKAIVFKDSRCITKIIRMSIAEFNVMFPKFKGKITPGSSTVNDMQYQSYKNPELKKAVQVYSTEIKKKNGRNCVLITCDGIEEEVDYYEDPIISNDFKIKYGAIDKYGKIYPMSRMKKAQKPQDDINHYMTIQFEHVDRAMRKIGVYMAGLSPSGQSAAKSSDVYALCEKISPQPVFEPMPAPQIPPENNQIVEMMKESINKAIGTSELAKSGESDNKLLGQDMLENQSFQQHSNSVIDALQDVADDILDTLKDIIMQVWDGDDYFKVTGISGGDQWYDPSMGPLADILVGDFKIKCNITTAQKPNPLKDKQDSIQYSQFMTNPLTVQFAAMHGKRPSMECLDNVVKQFGQSPEVAFEDLPPPMPMPGQGPIQIPQNKPLQPPIPIAAGAGNAHL